ncbi:MAG: efflux RND transporter permease subunit [Gammaproteobacteria bacterium]|nr:efflux RND transporter permease subunit [Gammaproteobacteria bacterium]MBI5616043.1 efflux RND transporter permease subunit [Gammaproteobacteria bacterium]
MWIVELALRRPYTFVVMSLLILITGVYSIRVTPKDIFPQIDIPIITVLWTYSGLSAEDMANRVTSFSEFSIANSAGDVQRIESQTLPGIAIIKVYFQPNAKVETAMAEITGISQTILRRMPPGTQPPIVVRYNASSVPILQMAMSSPSLTASQLYDFGAYRVRQQLIGVNGMRLPLPFGGAPRQIMVDLDMHALTARGLTPLDVSRAVNVQNLVLPSGTAKIGDTDYIVSLNSNPDAIATLNEVPVKTVNGAIVRIRDVANVRDGYAVQTNVVRRDSQDSTLITFLKMGNASTLNVIRDIKARLPAIRAAAPPDLNVDFLFDQSRFVEAAIDGVVFAGAVAAALVALLVMIFLASWRSTVIVATSIPLAVLTSLSLLAAMGQSLNVMTLGGLALAVGVLVDDAIVAIENIHRYLELGDPLEAAIRNGSAQIALPAFVSSLVIAIVFLPVLFLEGAAKFLFVPLGLAVVFAVGASYVLSRTLVPVMAKYLLPGEVRSHAARNSFGHRFQAGFERGFHAVQNAFAGFLGMLMRHRIVPIVGALLVIASAIAILPHVGRDFFPTIDGGQFRLHVKTPTGTRLEETSRIFSRVEDAIRDVIPAADRAMMIDNIGLPEGLNLAWGTDNTNIGMFDGEILVSLSVHKRRSTQDYMRLVRERVVHDFPALKFYYQPGDMTSQILNFGIPAPIDVQVVAFDPPKAYALAQEIEKRVKAIPGAVDVRVHQQIDAPDLRLNVDRLRAADLGLTQNDVASNVLIALSGSGVVTPNFWIDPKAGRPVLVAVQAPQHRIDSIGEMMNVPIASGANGEVELLSNAATIEPKRSPAIISRSDAKPVFDVYAGVEGRDLGSVVAAVRDIVESYDGKLPPAVTISVRGQAASMDAAFSAMGYGLIFAVVLVYLVLVVNFHSWTAPFVILTALPGALSGIVWMLYLSHTTFSVPALMGAIMTVGVATANSILIVSFANGEVENGVDARTAALRAATVRLRPVMITAAAMIVGMIPMALGIGEGGEQNAPLGRAVIGGLSLATLATLLFVPVAYSLVYRRHRGAEPLTAARVARGAEE